MLKFQVEGINSFIDNITDLKINDIILLKLNPNNKISNKAIGLYTINHKKIGYAPFKYSENINLNFKVINIHLGKKEIIIGAEYNEINYLEIIPINEIILNMSDKEKEIIQNMSDKEKEIIKNNLKLLKIKLEKLNYEIKDIFILYNDENFIDINIQIPDKNIIFHTVTKKYYDDNILKYNEFFDNKLISYCIYVPFFINKL